MDDGTALYFGSAVKAMGNGKVGGYLVLFSTDNDPDLTGEFFTKATDFYFDEDEPHRPVVLYDHGLDATLKTRKLGRGTVKVDDVGVWVEAQLALRDDYEKAVYAMAEAGKLGWSSGSASHMVTREKVKKSIEIKSWAIAEASLTPIPSEPRTSAITLKSYQEAKSSDESIFNPISPITPNSTEVDAPAALPFVDHSEAVLAAVRGVTTRAKSIQELRIKSGRVLSATNRERLGTLLGSLLTAAADIKALLDDTEVKPPAEEAKSADPEVIYGLLAQFEQHKYRASCAA